MGFLGGICLVTLALAVRYQLTSRAEITTFSQAAEPPDILVSSLASGVNTDTWYVQGWFNFQRITGTLLFLHVIAPNTESIYTEWDKSGLLLTSRSIFASGGPDSQLDKWVFIEDVVTSSGIVCRAQFRGGSMRATTLLGLPWILLDTHVFRVLKYIGGLTYSVRVK